MKTQGRPLLYRLDGHEPVAEPDARVWAEWLSAATDRLVGQETIRKATVSTVFLGIDHAWSGGDPILFETVVFGPDYVNVISRYRTWDEAEAGHTNVVRELRGLPK